jgi:hypothetical protein
MTAVQQEALRPQLPPLDHLPGQVMMISALRGSDPTAAGQVAQAAVSFIRSFMVTMRSPSATSRHHQQSSAFVGAYLVNGGACRSAQVHACNLDLTSTAFKVSAQLHFPLIVLSDLHATPAKPRPNQDDRDGNGVVAMRSPSATSDRAALCCAV